MSNWWDDIPVGAYFVTNTNGFFAKLIQYGCRSKRNHAGLHTGGGNTYEAKGRGYVEGHLSSYRAEDIVFNLSDFDPANPHGLRMTPLDGRKVVAQATLLLGRKYGFLTIAYLALAVLGIRWHWLLDKVANQKHLICSQAVDYAYYLANLHLFTDNRPFAVVKPDDLEERLLDGDRA